MPNASQSTADLAKAVREAPSEQISNDQMAERIAQRPVHGFRRTLGYKTTVWSDRYSEVTLEIDGRHDNSHGIVHGGVYATLLDAAFGGAVAYCGTPGRTRSAVTMTLTTTYIAPARQGLLTARGRVLGIEGPVATCSGEVVRADGTLCATGQASFMYLHGSEQPDGIAIGSRSQII